MSGNTLHNQNDEETTVVNNWLALACFLLVLGVGMLIGYGWRAYTEPRPIATVSQPSEAERRWIEKRHRQHGISVSIMENGQFYFYRDGKRCKL